MNSTIELVVFPHGGQGEQNEQGRAAQAALAGNLTPHTQVEPTFANLTLKLGAGCKQAVYRRIEQVCLPWIW